MPFRNEGTEDISRNNARDTTEIWLTYPFLFKNTVGIRHIVCEKTVYTRIKTHNYS